MKARHYILSLLAALVGAVGMKAQDNNRLTLPDLATLPGKTVALPLNMDNTAEVVAVEFDIQLPEGSTLDPTTSKLSNRSADHAVRFKAMGNDTYHCLIYSPTNSALLGRTGQLMTVNMQVSDAYEEGSEHEFALTNAVLALRDGSNGLTAVQAGKLIIQKGPDLTVEDMSADATTYAPGQTAVVSWQVKNIGALATGAGWTEYLSVRNAAGVTKLLATTSYDETLAAGGTVSRQVEVVLPAVLTLDGEAQFIVEVQPLAATGESQGLRWNNTAASTPVVFEKMLILTLPKGSVQETYRDPIRCTLMRSGDRTTAETFTIAATADSRVTIPTTVTIPAGQSSEAFYVQLTDNTTLDDNGIIHVTATGNGYPEASGQFEIEDNEYPDLNVTASTDNIYEGETFQLTVSATRAPKADLTVSFSAENATRFTFPATAVIPAGQTSVTVDVTVKDDDVPNLTFSNAFRANATGYNRGEAVVIVNDDDVPSLELLLTPNKVSEADGPIAVAATLRRTGVTNNRITVRLSDDTGGGIYYGRTEIVLEKGVEEAHLNLGPIDNATVDGDRVANITAAVYISSCSCNATGESAGVVTAQLTILDDDGPALKLTSAASTLLEGSSTTLTVGRNTADTTQPLTVTLSSDQDSRLTYEKLVTIPAGQTTATVALASQANDVQGDSFTAVFTATSEGFSSGTTYIMVTDQTLPDARITLTADKAEAEVGAEVTLTATVGNEGNAPLPAGTEVKLYSASSTLTLLTSQAMEVGQSETFTKVVLLPTAIGVVRYYAVVNENDATSELSKTNNTSNIVELRTTSPYSVAVNIEKSVYGAGEPVAITGKVSGASVAGKEVDVYVVLGSARESILTRTDANGDFAVVWKPSSAVAGHFVVGACYPGENKTSGMCSFDVHGLRTTTSGYTVCDVLQGETKSGAIGFENMSELPLTGVRAEVIAKPAGCDITVDITTSIEGAARADMAYRITGTSVTEQNEWEEIKLRISTNEGVSRDVSLWFYCRALEPKLMITPDNITTTMVKGQTRDYPFTITNVGKAATSDITLLLPDWMTSATGTGIAPLAQGESTTIVLKLTPNDGMELNRCVHGSFGINYGGSGTAVVNMAVTPVSQEKGTLVVDVKDEYTFYAEGAPHVEGAAVVIKRPAGEVVAEGVSGQDGICRFELPEGSYIMTVSAAEHTSKTMSFILDPGVETHKGVTLSMGQNAIKLNYSVEKTDVADAYVATTEVTYKTNVPVPVVVLTCPTDVHGENMQAGEQKLLTFILTNKGLISANNVYLDIPEENDYWSMKALSSTEPFTLAPQTSKSITVLLTKKSGAQSAPRRAQKKEKEVNPLLVETYSGAKSTFDRCMANMAFQYYWMCGDELENNEAAMTFALATCTAGAVAGGLSNLLSYLQFGGIGGGGGGNGGSPSGAPNSTSNNTYKPDYSQDKPVTTKEMVTFCDPKDAACGIALIESMLSRGNGIGKKGIEGLLSHSKKLQEIKESYKKAQEEGRSQDDADKERIREFIKEKYDEIRDVVKDAQVKALDDATSSSVPSNVAGWLKTAKEIYEIAEKCEHTYNKLNPRQPNGRGDAIQTMYDYAKLLANGYDVVTEMAGTEKWADVFEQHGVDWIGYVADYDWPNGDIESFFASAPDITRNKDVVALAERVQNTYNHFLNLYERKSQPKQVRRAQSYTDEGIEAVPVEHDYIDFDRLIALMTEMEELEAKAVAEGYESLEAKFFDAYDAYQEYYNDPSEHVCATLKLEFKQDIRLTREAFEGTLEVFNGHESKAIRDFRMNLTVTDTEGNLATTDVIDQKLKDNQGFGGQTDELYGSWTLDANATGTAVVLFTPSALAAPESPRDYLFGGTVTYIDPFTELEVTRELIPVQMQINPSPQLELTYFLQSDIYGDDPLTLDVVEAKVPAEFAVLIRNKGYGQANNFQMVTHQPEITVNEKELDNDFKIVSSSLNGSGQIPAIGEDVLTEFGNIAAQGTAFAQWWFESDLSGSFSEYNTTLKSVSYDNAKMSLVSLADTPIHNLIRSIRSTDDSNLTGFLCNDEWDALNRPDMLYLTNGETADVAVAANVTVSKLSATDYELTVTPSATGWNYGVITDPTQGYSELKSVVRKSDGREISLRNFWQTDRTLIDGKDWLYDNNLHFADKFSSGAETYVLTFEPTPEVVLDVASFSGIPAEGDIATEDVQSVSVTFSKTIDPATFTADDITMNVQAERQDASLIGISTEDNKTFALDLAAINATAPNGYYTLAVQTADIIDADGYNGKTGKTASWILYRGGLVQLLTSAYPEVAGNVQRVTEAQVKGWHAPASATEASAAYGSTVTLSATPNYGYEFSGWTLNGKPVGSSEPTLTTQAVGDMDVVANFRKKGYSVTIDTESDGGTVAGAGTGIYEYETQLTLTAAPDDDYILEGWTVDGQDVEGGATLTLTVTKATDVHARFVKAFTPGDVNGDGEIDIADVMAMHAHILQVSPQNFNVRAADLNADGLVEIDDVMNLHSIILKKQLIKSHQSLYRTARKAE